ncbi:MAG: hypothetical protein ACRC5H_03605 [Treponemataceae bacterium]
MEEENEKSISFYDKQAQINDDFPLLFGDGNFSSVHEKTSIQAIKNFTQQIIKTIERSDNEVQATARILELYEKQGKNRKEIAQALANVRYVSVCYGGKDDH